jgi:hypothetical protein
VAVPKSEPDTPTNPYGSTVDKELSNVYSVSDEGLRRRQVDEPDSMASSTMASSKEVVEKVSNTISRAKDTATTQLQQAPTIQGVPVPTVALLCLIVFLLTYFLF